MRWVVHGLGLCFLMMVLLVSGLSLAQGAGAVPAQPESQWKSTIGLVVMLEVRCRGQLEPEAYGTGLIFNVEDGQIHIVTARHVVDCGENDGKSKIDVFLRSPSQAGVNGEIKLEAQGRHYLNSEFDLAVLRVPLSQADEVPLFQVDGASLSNRMFLSFARLGILEDLRENTLLGLVGYGETLIEQNDGSKEGRRKKWNQCRSGLVFIREGWEAVYTRSTNADVFYVLRGRGCESGGYSGGVVVNERWEIFGIHLNVYEDGGAAYSIDKVEAVLKQSGFNSALRLSESIAPAIEEFKSSVSYIKNGEAVTLSWNGRNVDSCLLMPNSYRAGANGAINLKPTVSTEYVLQCRHGKRQIESKLNVYVEQPPEILQFKATPEAVAVPGDVTLSWIVRGEGQCTIWGGERFGERQRIPVVGEQGEIIVQVKYDSSFELRCEKTGWDSAAKHVSVPYNPNLIYFFSVDPAEINERRPVKVVWRAPTATFCTLNDTGDNELPSEVWTVGEREFNPVSSTTYELVCSLPKPRGVTSQDRDEYWVDKKVVNLKVSNRVEIIELIASKPIIFSEESSELRWDARNATSCELEGVLLNTPPMQVSPRGRKSFSPGKTERYRLTCQGENGPVNQTVTVQVW